MNTITAALHRALARVFAYPRVRALTMLALLTVPPLMLTACIQPQAVFDEYSTVTVQITAPPSFPIAGVRVAVSGSGLTAGDNDFAFTDTTGFAQIRTKETGFHYIVARHADYDIGYGGTAANLTLGGPFQVYQRGRLNIPSVSSAVAPDYLFPFTGNEVPPQQAPRQLGLRKKTPKKARFVFMVEDSPVLKRTFQPDLANPAGKVYVTGDFNNYSLTVQDQNGQPADGAIEMFDDGSLVENSGDDQIGDGVFTRIVDLPPGEHTYVFLVNGISVFNRDPYEEFSKPVRVLVRNPLNNLPNQGLAEIREFRASAITVTDDPADVQN
jgi:hypothetical protein